MTAELATPGWFSVLPPLLAIGIALWTRAVLPALFLGIWVGAWGLAGLDLAGLGQGLMDTIGVHVRGALADADHAAVILFSMMIGGLVGILSRSGGMQGIVNGMLRFAHNRRRGQLGTALLGMVIFIDDYANSLVVGRTMRPLTDSLRISREKLAYLVDSMAAPVSAVAIITTWVGYQVGLIGDASAQLPGLDTPPYVLLLHSIAYSFYPWFAIFLVLAVAWTGRDFGPMRVAEQRALQAASCPDPAGLGSSGEPGAAGGHDRGARSLAEAAEAPPALARNALIPLAVMVGGVLLGLWYTGEGDTLRDIAGSADSYRALMWASMAAVLVAVAMPLLQRQSTLDELMKAWGEGAGHMLPAMIILVLAWALAAVGESLGTGPYLVSLLDEGFPAGVLPALIFLLAGATAFATGTSWGTMGILLPLTLPLAYGVAPEAPQVLYSSIAAVLAGAVWGDHCSPISDTTILSSMASGCDHVEHVRTQLPYAMLAGGVALVVGVLPSGFGMPWWASLILGCASLVLLLRWLGQPLADGGTASTRAGE